jgi:hypothetical protein
MKRSLPLALAIAAYVIVVIVWLAIDKHVPRKAFDDFSAENTSGNGLSLARRYLTGRGRRVSLLQRPIDARFLPRNAVIFRAGSLVSFFDFLRQIEEEREAKDDEEKAKEKTKSKNAPKKTTLKKNAPPALTKLKLKLKRTPAMQLLDAEEEEWVRGGGRLVLATTGSYGGLTVHGTTQARALKVFPMWRGIDAIDEPEPRAIAGEPVLRISHALYTIGDQPAVARLPLGAGDLILIPAPELFTNDHVAKNLPLLTALAGEKRPVYFDEVVHGQRSDDGVLPMMKDWNLGPFLLLGLLGFALALWRNGVSVGPREDDFRDTRSEAVDLVDSLGALYEQSMTNGDAIALYHHALTRAVAAQSGLRGDPLHRRVDDLTGLVRVPGKGEKLDLEMFRASMTKINEAFARIER